MNGAESWVKSLLASGVTTIFANPGTPEMHFVAALDQHPDTRCILCLFEGGASGAADGYFRMSGQVAATLLHLAPGFGNAFANLHNAAKAGCWVLNIVADHATCHQVRCGLWQCQADEGAVFDRGGMRQPIIFDENHRLTPQ